MGDRYKDDRVSAACLAGGWSLILIPVYISHKPDQNQMTIVFCRHWSATLRRITRAVPLSSLPRRIIPTCPSASLLHSRSVRLEASRMVALGLLECEACKPPLVALAAQNSDPMAQKSTVLRCGRSQLVLLWPVHHMRENPMLLRPAYPISRGYLCYVCGPFGALEPTRLHLPPDDESKRS